MARGKRKERPEASKDEIREVMRFHSELNDIRLRTQYFPIRRPSFMRKIKMNVSSWEKNGTISYDRKHAARIHPEDQQFLAQYARDMRVLFYFEKGINGISDNRTRLIGQRYFLEGKSIREICEECQLCSSTVYLERDNARRIVAKFIRKQRKEYGHEQASGNLQKGE